MTALLEYLNLALAIPSWISCYNSVALSRHSSPIFKFWKNVLFICSIDKSIDCRSQKYIVCWVGINYFGMHNALKLKKVHIFSRAPHTF